jgi:hypothetical protein
MQSGYQKKRVLVTCDIERPEHGALLVTLWNMDGPLTPDDITLHDGMWECPPEIESTLFIVGQVTPSVFTSTFGLVIGQAQKKVMLMETVVSWENHDA